VNNPFEMKQIIK